MSKSRFITIVGNRNGVPENILNKIKEISKLLVDKGFSISTGDAVGCDRYAWEGAKESENYSNLKHRIYFPNFTGKRLELSQTDNNTVDASKLFYTEALSIACRLSPHIVTLPDFIQRLHARSVHQIAGDNFNEISEALIYYSETIDPLREIVKGGTNTAVQTAIYFKVKHRINLYGKTEEEIDLDIKNLLRDLIPLKLFTIQMGKWRNIKNTGIELIDVTYKTNNAFAPERSLVMDYKRGFITEDEYTKHYNDIMEWSIENRLDEWLELIEKDSIALACMCTARKFCHRHLLIPFIEFLCWTYGRGVVRGGEIE